MGRHSNAQAARDAAVLLLSGDAPEAVEGFLRKSVEGNATVSVPPPRGSEDARQAVTS